MKVFYLTNIPSPYRVDFFNELGKYCDLTVLFERRNAKDRNLDWISGNIRNFKAVYLQGIKYGSDSAFCPSILKWLRKDLFDVFVIGGYGTTTSMLAIEILRLKKLSFYLNADGGFIKGDQKFIARIKRHFISSASWWLSTGERTTNYLEYYGANRKRVMEYPFSSILKKELINVPSTLDEKSILKKDLNINFSKVVISVGQFIYRKGFDVLLEAWANIEYQDTGLLIIGGGEKYQEYQELILKKNIKNVILIDFVEKSKLIKYLQCSDIFVFPTREDIWGLVVNEAMSNGLPVITTDRCLAGLELVKNNGFIVPIENSHSLLSNLNKILKNEDLRVKMAQNSLDIIKTYTIENMAKTHFDIFRLNNK
jgi:glycosyltransferase involved in cell wall biosynthesis